MSKEPLVHGENCQCVVHRAERFVQRGQAAQKAVDAEIKKAKPKPKAKR